MGFETWSGGWYLKKLSIKLNSKTLKIIKTMKKEVLNLLKKHPHASVWVTHLVEEENNGDLTLLVNNKHIKLKNGEYLSYIKLKNKPDDSYVTKNDGSSSKEKTCLIAYKKDSTNKDPWEAGITQWTCPPTQMVFKTDNDNLDFDLI